MSMRRIHTVFSQVYVYDNTQNFKNITFKGFVVIYENTCELDLYIYQYIVT